MRLSRRRWAVLCAFLSSPLFDRCSHPRRVHSPETISNVHHYSTIGQNPGPKEELWGEVRTPLAGTEAGDEGFLVRNGSLNGEDARMPGITGPKEVRESFSNSEKATIGKGLEDTAKPGLLDQPSKMNGTHSPTKPQLMNGVVDDQPMSNNNGVKIEDASQPSGRLPPEIEHITFGYRPMSQLVARLVQETFNGLGEVINEMADVPFPPTPPQLNGVVNHNNTRPSLTVSNDNSQANITKKTMMFDFANSRRAQFIKLLVLSKWARQAESISRVIDLRIWLAQKQQDYSDAIHWVGMLKRNLVNLKEPGPDIKTALEILSLGKASWISHLGYLAPEKLTAHEMLAGLRRINTLLSIRLKLHEDIPHVFRSFSVRSGRATFKIVDECEIDLSIADEDLTKQLYFVDLRLLFSPASSDLPAGRLRMEFETRANEVLAHDGLRGLFDFAHNMILTHKITILRNQAYDLAKTHGVDHFRVERLRRNFVLQYWRDRPGPKSWVEFGVRRGRSRVVASTGEEERISEIALRWFRDGKEVSNPNIDLRLSDLSITHVMDQVLAIHTTVVFSEILTKLYHDTIFASDSLKMKLNQSSTNPSHSSLLVQLTASKAIKICRDSISGRFAVLPPSNLNSRVESDLNNTGQPAVDGANEIARLRSGAAHEEVDWLAIRAGWVQVRTLRPTQEVFQRMFHKGTQRARYYRKASWLSHWLLAFTTSHDGDSFWVLDMGSAAYQRNDTLSSVASATDGESWTAYNLSVRDSATTSLELSPSLLTRIERAAAGVISHSQNLRHLSLSRIPFKTQAVPAAGSQDQTSSIFLKLPQKPAPNLLPSTNYLRLPWAHEVVRLDYQGLDRLHSCAVHTASARVSQLSKEMRDLAASIDSTTYHPNSGAFSVSLRSKVGKTVIPQLLYRLSAIGRLHEYISIIKAQKMTVNKISLHVLEFTYQSAPDRLRASIHFHTGESSRISLPPTNPHIRILDHLNVSLRVHGLTGVLSLLATTLPLLTVLAQLEESHESSDFKIVSHSEQWYEVRYSATVPSIGFDIQLRQRRDTPHWLISERIPQSKDLGSEEAQWRSDLRAVTRGRGEGWRGMNGGIVASTSAVQEAVKKLDGILSSANRGRTPEASRSRKRKAEGELVEID